MKTPKKQIIDTAGLLTSVSWSIAFNTLAITDEYNDISLAIVMSTIIMWLILALIFTTEKNKY